MTSKKDCMVRFSLADDENLVKMVATHPILWNMRHSGFKNYVKKDKIWVRIAQLLNKSDQQCRVRWRSIRDHYKRQKKYEKKSETGYESSRKRASYWKELGFLEGEEEELESYASSHSSENLQERGLIDSTYVLEEDPLAIKGDEETRTQEDKDGSKSLKMLQYSTPVEVDSSNEVRVVKAGSNESDVEILKVTAKEKPRGRTYADAVLEPDCDDEIDLFFKAMAATVKKFSPADRTEAKMKIFGVISVIETRQQNPCNNVMLGSDESDSGRTTPESSES